MKYLNRTYTKDADGKWVIAAGVAEETTPLTEAVEAFAAAHPGQIIMGASVNDEVKHVGPLEPPPEGGDV